MRVKLQRVFSLQEGASMHMTPCKGLVAKMGGLVACVRDCLGSGVFCECKWAGEAAQATTRKLWSLFKVLGVVQIVQG